MSDQLKTTEDIFEWMDRINQYEEAHESPKIELTREEIVIMLQSTLGRLRDVKKSDEYTPFEKRMLFIKWCIVRQILDDLLCVPESIRPWTASERKWLDEMNARQNSDRGVVLSKEKSKKERACEARMDEILKNISE